MKVLRLGNILFQMLEDIYTDETKMRSVPAVPADLIQTHAQYVRSWQAAGFLFSFTVLRLMRTYFLRIEKFQWCTTGIRAHDLGIVALSLPCSQRGSTKAYQQHSISAQSYEEKLSQNVMSLRTWRRIPSSRYNFNVRIDRLSYVVWCKWEIASLVRLQAIICVMFGAC